MASDAALVLFSGGQDSTTCLLWAKQKFSHVDAICFHYGQKHSVELECAQTICKKHSVPLKMVDLSFLSSLSHNALTDENMEPTGEKGENELPTTFVPGRNALFLTSAVCYAIPKGINDLVIGACEVDYSGYPDCRDDFIQSQQQTLSLALGQNIIIHTPLMQLDKAETFQLAKDLDGLNDVIELSHTCYRGDRSQRHPWGYGCNNCDACHLRKNGFEQFKHMNTIS
ncbi:MAG TPA: 7-cyano-7-deazaguanine synthase QueC [Oligoflexia bacterium]|nr:7-cyano-7-deazaguanine synthase QueC [Oligoflexia bacterium]HMR23970.1 7-cyano-7-deazaguanine synthase QueC [Oligoflexia bacterium]